MANKVDLLLINATVLTMNEKMDMFKNISMLIEKSTRSIAEDLKRQLGDAQPYHNGEARGGIGIKKGREPRRPLPYGFHSDF